MTEDDFREYNPHILGDRVPASERSTITVYVPNERLARFVQVVKNQLSLSTLRGRTLRPEEVDKINPKTTRDTIHHAKNTVSGLVTRWRLSLRKEGFRLKN